LEIGLLMRRIVCWHKTRMIN